MYVRPTAPLSIGGVIDDGIKLYRASFARLWPIALLYALLRGAAAFVVSAAAFNSGMGLQSLSTIAVARSPLINAANFAISVLSLALVGALVASQASVTSSVEQMPVGAALGLGFRRLLFAVVAVILFALAVIGGMILLVIPGLYLLGALYLWYVALYVDHAGPVESLRISYRLVKGHWWRSATILTVAGILFFAFAVIGGLISAAALLLVHGNLTAVMMVASFSQFVIILFLYPFFTALMVSIYRDLQLRREGGDLAARADSLQPA